MSSQLCTLCRRFCDNSATPHSVIKECQKLISKWLENMGLELKPSKTRLTHTLHNVGKEKAGFNFLGFNIRQHKVGKYNSGKNSQKQTLGFKTIIQPSKKSIKEHYQSLAETVDKHKSSKQEVLIGHLNPIIRGWCNYFSTSVCKKVFSNIEHLLHWKLYKWAVNRHRKMKKKDVKNKYFHQESFYDRTNNKYISRDWIFSTTIDEKIGYRLLFHSDTKAIRFIKVKGKATPYDGNLIYWSTRLGRNPLMPYRKAKLLKAQKGKCNWCNLTFRHEDVIEVDHIIPTIKGGNDYYKNLQLLHRHCHDEKTAIDGSNESPREKF